jgi:hypothetical protein
MIEFIEKNKLLMVVFFVAIIVDWLVFIFYSILPHMVQSMFGLGMDCTILLFGVVLFVASEDQKQQINRKPFK